MPDNTESPPPPRVIHPADLVQIIDAQHKWFPTVVVVSEVKSWGVQGFCFWPSNTEPPKKGYIRLQTGQFEYCGVCRIIEKDLDRARRDSIASHEALAAETAR